MSQFAFLAPEWPALHDAAAKAESLVYPDPRAACFYARRALELAVHWIYKNDGDLKLPYQESLSTLIHELSFWNTVGPMISAKSARTKSATEFDRYRAIQDALPRPVDGDFDKASSELLKKLPAGKKKIQ